MQRFIVFVLSLSVASVAASTAQLPETIIVDDQRYGLLSTPLESYLVEHELEIESSSGSSALWRRYVGLWRIDGGMLSLVSLHDCDYKHPEGLGPELNADQLFPNQKPPYRATWYSGVLRIQIGNELQYVHMGFDSIYSKERFILIESGHVVRDWTADRKGKDCGRSTFELDWATRGGADLEDHLHWVDVRELVEEPGTERRVVTRGVAVFVDTESRWVVGVPRSAAYQQAYLELRFGPAVHLPKDQSPVEIEGDLFITDDSAFLVAREISELVAGQTIHHPNYAKCEPQERPESE